MYLCVYLVHVSVNAQMEDELGEALPYWDWTEDKKVPELWEGIKKPIKEPEKSACNSDRRFAGRNKNITMDTDQLKKDMKNAFEKDSFLDFLDKTDHPHRLAHLQIGCELGGTSTGSYDHVFFLHHSFIDFLWAFWQELQKLRGIDEYVVEFDRPLPPFDRSAPIEGKSSFFNGNAKTLKHSKGVDVVDYQGNLCYEYDELKFDGMTPAEYLTEKDGATDETINGEGAQPQQFAFRAHSTLTEGGGGLSYFLFNHVHRTIEVAQVINLSQGSGARC